MTNYKTTIAGLVAAVAAALIPVLQKGGFNLSEDWPKLLIAVAIAVLGLLAKDHDVTGGTPSTPATRT